MTAITGEEFELQLLLCLEPGATVTENGRSRISYLQTSRDLVLHGSLKMAEIKVMSFIFVFCYNTIDCGGLFSLTAEIYSAIHC